jgi:hypothetical protein
VAISKRHALDEWEAANGTLRFERSADDTSGIRALGGISGARRYRGRSLAEIASRIKQVLSAP